MARTIVMLHGFTHTAASWDGVRAALSPRRQVIAADIRGHGSAAAQRPVTLEAVIDDVAALAPPRFTLLGYSMGGRLALHAALALGERVEYLVLVGASPGIADPAQRAARHAADERLADEIEHSSIEEFARRWAQTPVLVDQPPEVAAAVHTDRLRNTPEGLARALRGLGTGALPSLWDRLDELVVPVSLVAGERDQRFRATAQEMALRIPAAEVEVVNGAGHAVHLEAPDDVAEILAGTG